MLMANEQIESEKHYLITDSRVKGNNNECKSNKRNSSFFGADFEKKHGLNRQLGVLKKLRGCPFFFDSLRISSFSPISDASRNLCFTL